MTGSINGVRRQRASAGWVLCFAAALLGGCSGVQLISGYDEVTDKSLTALQEKTDDFISSLEKSSGSPAAAFDTNADFYTGLDKDLRKLEFRAASMPKNKHTTELMGNIRKVILGTGPCNEDGASLRDLHCIPENKDNGPSVTALQITQRNINQTISAALQLELAKKQGIAPTK